MLIPAHVWLRKCLRPSVVSSDRWHAQPNKIHHFLSCSPFFHMDSWLGFCRLVIYNWISDRWHLTSSRYASIFIVNLLLLFRTYAIWQKSKVILVSLSVLLAVCEFISKDGCSLIFDSSARWQRLAQLFTLMWW